MKTIMMAVVLAALAGCGADGAPMAPTATDTKPGVTVSGDAQIGVVVGNP